MTLFLSLALLLAFSTKALANPACAVCTVAVGASLEIARHYGVDDAVVGVWAGALLALLGYWLILWFDKKNWHFSAETYCLWSFPSALSDLCISAKFLTGHSRFWCSIWIRCCSVPFWER